MKTKPRIIGINILSFACGFLERPSSAEATVLPCPVAAPNAARPIASPAPIGARLTTPAAAASDAKAQLKILQF